MAFFGLTHLGYQNPIGDKMKVNPRGASHPQAGEVNNGELPPSQEQQGAFSCTDKCSVDHQPLPDSTAIHHGSHEQYKEMVKRIKTPKSPNQLYKMPLTDNQQYGWMMSKSPEPWTQVKRFPRKNSEMTKFVQEMSMADWAPLTSITIQDGKVLHNIIDNSDEVTHAAYQKDLFNRATLEGIKDLCAQQGLTGMVHTNHEIVLPSRGDDNNYF